MENQKHWTLSVDQEGLFEFFLPATGQDDDYIVEWVGTAISAIVDDTFMTPMDGDSALGIACSACAAVIKHLVLEGVLIPLRTRSEADLAKMIVRVEPEDSYDNSRWIAMRAAIKDRLGIPLSNDERERLGRALDVLEEARSRDPVNAIMKLIMDNAPPGVLTPPSGRRPCCERDHDGDGNCDRHPGKGRRPYGA